MNTHNLNRNLKECRIPFCGFYESEAMWLIDNEVEMAFDYNGSGEPDIPENFYDYWDTKDISIAFCRDYYVDAFLKYFEDITSISIDLKFKEMTSPRFYNFETDKVYCHISARDLRKLYDAVSKPVLNTMVKDRHSSREGFISFYSNELAKGEWLKPVEDWDAIQIETLFYALLRQHDVEAVDYFTVFEDANANGDISEVVWGNCPKECLDMLTDYELKHIA